MQQWLNRVLCAVYCVLGRLKHTFSLPLAPAAQCSTTKNDVIPAEAGIQGVRQAVLYSLGRLLCRSFAVIQQSKLNATWLASRPTPPDLPSEKGGTASRFTLYAPPLLTSPQKGEELLHASRTFALVTLCLLFLSTSAFAAGVSLIWDPNAEEIPYVAGYKIHYGYSAGAYEMSIDVDNQTSYLVTGLTEGVTYYFAVTAYDSDGYETSYSNELSYTVPIASPAADDSSDDGGSSSGGGSSGGGGGAATDDNPATEPQCTADAECDDGLFCTGIETCENNVCVQGDSPCTADELCDEDDGTCIGSECGTDADCDDAAFCNGEESCINGYCTPGSPPCDAGETCDEVTDTCQVATETDTTFENDETEDDNPADGTGNQHTLSATCLTQDVWRPRLMNWRFVWLILSPERDFYFNDSNYVIRIKDSDGNASGVEFDIARKPTQYFNFILIPVSLSRTAAKGLYTVMIKSYPVDDTLVASFTVR